MFREHGDLSSRWVRVRMRKGRLNPPPWHRCSGKQLWHLPSPWPGVLSWPRLLSWLRVPRICQWGGREPPELAQAPDSQKGSAQQILLLLLSLPPSEGPQATGSLLLWAVPHRPMLCLVGGPPTPPVLSEVRPSKFCAARAEPGAPGWDLAPQDGGLGSSRAEVLGCGHQVLPVGTEFG